MIDINVMFICHISGFAHIAKLWKKIHTEPYHLTTQGADKRISSEWLELHFEEFFKLNEKKEEIDTKFGRQFLF